MSHDETHRINLARILTWLKRTSELDSEVTAAEGTGAARLIQVALGASGSVNQNVEPLPGVLSTPTLP
jgi:hypothetical protein